MLMSAQLERVRPVTMEQRKNMRLRERFDAAMTLLRPLLKTGVEKQGAVYFRALGKLHEAYPDMSQSELEALAVSVVRALNSR